MRVFLSWSGSLSHDLAKVLDWWIPLVIQSARTFFSEDIDKGQRWSAALGEQLSESDYGIVCVTKDNVTAPWLHFEAGAISKAIGKSYVSPLLFNIKPGELRDPLSQFQVTVCEKDDIFRLMRSINSRLPTETQLSDELLTSEFTEWWPKLEKELERIKEIATKQVEGVSHTAYKWLYTTEDLTLANLSKKDAQIGPIWWITPEPFLYLLKEPVILSINDGINRNVVFTIMIPPNAPNRDEALQSFNYIARDKPGNFQVVEICKEEEFHRAAVTDYVVVDPNSASPKVFLELPIGDRGYWIHLDDAAALGIAKRFRDMKDMWGKIIGRSTTVTAPPDATPQATQA